MDVRTGIENRCSNQKHRIQHISLLLETLKKLGMSNNGNIQHMHCWGHQGWEALLMIQAYLCLESKSFEVVQDTLVQTQGVGWWFVFDGEDEDDGAWRLLPGVWKFIRRNSTGSVGWWEGNSLPLGRLPFLASDSALFLKEIHTSGQTCVWTIRAALQEAKHTRSWCTFKCDTSWRCESREQRVSQVRLFCMLSPVWLTAPVEAAGGRTEG